MLKLGGSSILSLYNYSPSKLVTTLFPNYDWLPWKFNLSSGVRKNKQIARDFMESLKKKLDYNDYKDWYQINNQVKKKIILH